MMRFITPVLVLTLVSVWMVTLRPVTFGGPASFVMVSGTSMQPTLRTGDLVITRKQDDYKPGDVIAYQISAGLVIHRIVGGNATEGFITQGDNNSHLDKWRPHNHEIIGRQWVHLPGKAKWLEWLKQPARLAGFVGFIAALTLVSAPKSKDDLRRRNKRSAIPWLRKEPPESSLEDIYAADQSASSSPVLLVTDLWSAGASGLSASESDFLSRATSVGSLIVPDETRRTRLTAGALLLAGFALVVVRTIRRSDSAQDSRG